MRYSGAWKLLLVSCVATGAVACKSDQPTVREQLEVAREDEERALQQRYDRMKTEWERITSAEAVSGKDEALIESVDRRLEEAEEHLEKMKEAKSLSWAEHRERLGRTLDELATQMVDAQASIDPDEDEPERNEGT